MIYLSSTDIAGSGDDLDGSGNRGKGDRIVASGDNDDEDVYSGSGSGDSYDDPDYGRPNRPKWDEPGGRPGGRPDGRPNHTVRPYKPKPNSDNDIGFPNPNNPKYDIDKNSHKDKDAGGYASSIHMSTSALLVMSVFCMIRRIVL